MEKNGKEFEATLAMQQRIAAENTEEREANLRQLRTAQQQMWSFHKWYRYTTARQYRGLMINSGTPSFLVGTQDIGPHELSY